MTSFLAAAATTALAGPEISGGATRTTTLNSFEKSDTFSGYLFGKNNSLDAAYDQLQEWKKEYHLPIGISGQHWFHIDRDKTIYGNGYGVPNERGTYYYSLSFDPAVKFDGKGFLQETGFHFQGRMRDTDDKLRAFYKDTAWTYEAYAYAKTKAGTLKVGQIVQQFGIAWDNSWWEGVPYFNGYRFNPAYGVSWEDMRKISSSLSLESAVQYFIHDDRVSGAIAGADAESSLAGERNTFDIRLAPAWKINADTQIVLGASFLTREVAHIDRYAPGVLNDRQTAFETDLSVTWKNLTVFGQYSDSFGAISPANYVSGGPSNQQEVGEVGLNYKLGPISAHVDYSVGRVYNPYGHEYIFNPGLTFQLSKGLTLYTEYVKWNVVNGAGVKSRYDDGFELILAWNL